MYTYGQEKYFFLAQVQMQVQVQVQRGSASYCAHHARVRIDRDIARNLQ